MAAAKTKRSPNEMPEGLDDLNQAAWASKRLAAIELSRAEQSKTAVERVNKACDERREEIVGQLSEGAKGLLKK
jgi:hypothetical protein